MAKSKKKHKVHKRTQTQNLYTGPIPIQYVKRLKGRIRLLSGTMSDYNSLVDEKYKTNNTTTYISIGRNKPLYEMYNGDECSAIAGQVIALTWYKYSKIIYKMSQSLIDYIDNTISIPDDYNKILNNLPQKIIYVDLSDTDIMTYNGDKIYGFFINISSTPYHEMTDTSTGGHFNACFWTKAIEITGILSVVSDQLPSITIITPINEIVSYDHDTLSDYVDTQHSIWLTELVLKMALYLCINKPNIKNKKIIPSKNGTHQSVDVTIVDLSDQYKEGQVFDPHKTEKTVYVKDGESENTDKHMPPHVRTGHWQTYWTGKGRSVPVQKFVKECLVNCNDASKLPTVGHVVKEDK